MSALWRQLNIFKNSMVVVEYVILKYKGIIFPYFLDYGDLEEIRFPWLNFTF